MTVFLPQRKVLTMFLYPIFRSGMIFQANKPIRLFGGGGGRVSVEFCGRTVQKDFSAAKWILELEPVDYGGPFEMKITLDIKTIVLKDIYLGDVYLIAGQSNMQMKLSEIQCPELHQEVKEMKLYSTTRVEGGERFTPDDGWVSATEENITDFSAIGYLFGKEQYRRNGHSVGLVSLYQGAAAIQCFLPEKAFSENSGFNIPFGQRFDMCYKWNETPGIFFDFALREISPFSFSAVIWYQGESNCSAAESEIYHDMLCCLINSWREELNDSCLPFIVIQLHNFSERDNCFWHKIQKAQSDISLEIPFVRTIITADVSETDVIHPKNKLPVALRICDTLDNG